VVRTDCRRSPAAGPISPRRYRSACHWRTSARGPRSADLPWVLTKIHPSAQGVTGLGDQRTGDRRGADRRRGDRHRASVRGETGVTGTVGRLTCDSRASAEHLRVNLVHHGIPGRGVVRVPEPLAQIRHDRLVHHTAVIVAVTGVRVGLMLDPAAPALGFRVLFDVTGVLVRSYRFRIGACQTD